MTDISQTTAPTPLRPSLISRVLSFLGELTHVVLISLAIIIPVRYFLIQPFYVKGASMEPNFYDKEYLIIDEISYRFHEPTRGDIIVFRYPNDPRQFFIKRVIGLPGESIQIGDGRVRVMDPATGEGGLLDETLYLGDALTAGAKEVTLGAGEYYLLGDNRGSSLDSRTFGPVKRDFFIGKVWLRGWPPERMRFFGEEDHRGPKIIPELN
jgi:signal peptidase I